MTNSRMSFSAPSGAFLVADVDAIAGLLLDSASRESLDLSEVPLPIDADIPDEVVAKAEIIVVQADPASPKSIQRIVRLRASRPTLPIIVALRDADLAITRSLIHQGVNDVVSIPFDPEQLRSSLFEASVSADRDLGRQIKLAPIFTFIGGTGGCGTTTIATHVAAEFARRDSHTCCLVDLDVQFGTAAAFLGLPQQRSVADLLEAKERLDDDLIRSVADKFEHNMSVIAAPHDILPLEEVEVDQILSVLDSTRQAYDIVALDLPTNFTNWSLSAILDSSVVVMVVELSVVGLRQARRRLDLLAEMGFDRQRVRVVVNRAEKRLFKPIKTHDAERALKTTVLATITNDPATVGSAQDQGMLVSDFDPGCAFAKDIARLCEALSSELAGG